ncbi:MAG: (2Fe-2S)-binding protein [Candidatus Marinimicrobia bacterium]|nr:(2Fe-2S)-binding protein [Candidatus Neomarinimicrobiota bacterium]
MIVQFELNGKLVKTDVKPGKTLLEFLRDQQIHSVKHGCDHGECGACAVLLENRSVNACLILIHSVDGKKIETLENFSTHEHLHPLQESFLQAGAAQCGYCTPGMLLSLEALDREGHPVDEAELRDALNGNLCRCTGYVKPIEAAQKVFQNSKKTEALS